jgi:hypothetical protein
MNNYYVYSRVNMKERMVQNRNGIEIERSSSEITPLTYLKCFRKYSYAQEYIFEHGDHDHVYIIYNQPTNYSKFAYGSYGNVKSPQWHLSGLISAERELILKLDPPCS